MPDCVSAGLAPKGSLLEVVRFAKPVPEWLLRTLERTRRVEDAAAGAKLPRGEDWITRQGYLRERRGGRYAAPEQARFGKARLEALREQRGSIERSLTPLREQINELTARIRTQQAQLAGVDAAAQLAARAEEFAEARQHYDALVLRRRDNTVLQAQQEREIASKENRSARDEQIRRIRPLRNNHKVFPAGWCDNEANQQIVDKYRDTTNIDRRLEEIELRFKEESWETDDTLVPLRDKIRDDYKRMETDLTTRRLDNEMARGQTDSAREQYIAVLRHTVSRYVKNLKALGDLVGIEVDSEPVVFGDNDLTLAQAGLVVRFNFDDKGFMGMNDGDASGGQQVIRKCPDCGE